MSKKGYPSTIFEGKEADGAGTEYDVSNVDEISLMITTDDDADFSLAFFGHNKPGAVVDWAAAGAIDNKIAPISLIPMDAPGSFITTLAVSGPIAKLYKVNVESLSKINVVMSSFADGLCDIDVYGARDVN